MGDEHSDDLEAEVDDSAEIETEHFAAVDDDGDDDVETETSLTKRDDDLAEDTDHDDSM
jgi:hypothetical protein